MRTDFQPAEAGNARTLPLTQERLKEILHYDPETGVWRWLVTRGGRAAGSIAGTLDSDGYRRIMINFRQYRSSNLTVLYMLGWLPVGEVDHKDVNPSNDRWDNLREATSSQNMANRRAGKLGRSLPKGVYWSFNRFRAQIQHNGKQLYLGGFNTVEEAAAAYASAAVKIHGAFARAG
jgi:hypothetical protein